MSGKRGMKKYPYSIKGQVIREYEQGKIQRQLGKKYQISRYCNTVLDRNKTEKEKHTQSSRTQVRQDIVRVQV